MKGWTLDAFDAAPALRDDLPEPEGDDDRRRQGDLGEPGRHWILGGVLSRTAEYPFPVRSGATSRA